MEIFHTPVLLKEVINFLRVVPGENYIDGTLGGGGHTEEILKRGGKVLGIDYDPEAINYVRSKIQGQGNKENLNLVQGNFKDIKKIALSNNFKEVSGIILDLGVSTYQLLEPKRGFSFNSSCPLDMRMDPSLKVTAQDLVNGLTKEELYELLSKLGEEHDARAIAQALVRARTIKPIVTCRELADIVSQVKGRRVRGKKIHPATKTFQALRIAVNGELENLRLALPGAVEILKPQGRLIVISFHSLEDKIVKLFFKDESSIVVLTKHPIRPADEEISINPRSRGAKMRAAEKI